MLPGAVAYEPVERGNSQLGIRLGYNDPSTSLYTASAITRRAINPTTGGTTMRLDLSSVAYTLIFAGIAVWATSKLIRA